MGKHGRQPFAALGVCEPWMVRRRCDADASLSMRISADTPGRDRPERVAVTHDNIDAIDNQSGEDLGQRRFQRGEDRDAGVSRNLVEGIEQMETDRHTQCSSEKCDAKDPEGPSMFCMPASIKSRETTFGTTMYP